DVGWQIEPKFDASTKMVEWAILADTGSAKAVNHAVRLLGREGVLDGIAVQGGQSAGNVPLKQLMSGVRFKPGYTYADYQEGDQVSIYGLSDLVASGTPVKAAENFPYEWAFMGGGLFIALSTGIVILKRRSHRVQKPIHSKAANGSIAKSFKSPNNGVNGNGNGHHSTQHSPEARVRRKRVFDYQRY